MRRGEEDPNGSDPYRAYTPPAPTIEEESRPADAASTPQTGLVETLVIAFFVVIVLVAAAAMVLALVSHLR